MKFILPALFSCLFFFLASTAPESYHPGAIDRGRVYLILGQSNATGAHDVPSAQKTDRRIIMLAPTGQWVRGREGSNLTYPKYSPTMAFARELLRLHPDYKIALINCAVPGTSIAEWQKGGELYDNCLRYAKVQKKGKVAGIIFIQGESDTNDPVLARQWAAQFKRMVVDFRADLHNPALPVVFAKLGYAPEGRCPYWKIVQQQQTLARMKTSNTGLVATSDLEKFDQIHYGVASMNILGIRLARKWESIASHTGAVPGIITNSLYT